jgi:hypothetical protein
MLNKTIQRENEIFDILKRLQDNQVDFILVGGYAVSSFKHRFSVDADIVVSESELKKIIDILEQKGFKPFKSMDIQNMYSGKFKSFVKSFEMPVTVDLLINSISSRQTGASWSFELFRENCMKKDIVGIEKSINSNVPVKELLIATKLHSCRLTDIRDVVAICDKTDINKIKEFTLRGELSKLKENMIRFKELVKDKNFADSFKGVFSLEKLPVDNIDYSLKIVDGLLKAI